jgi:Fe(3+) dicitrate transport protein
MLLVSVCLYPFAKICSQVKGADDSVSFRLLDSIVVTSSLRLNATPFLKDIEGLSVLAGKKTNSVIMDAAKANLAGATTRMIFSQVPGVTLWDMSGTGGQVNIGSRGTDVHRAIEMNVRQNGYNVNSDVFGYPEAHYTAAMEGVQRIEIVRGSAALQFGPQFGGMINYIMKEGDSTKPLGIESEQTGGSFGFFNSFNSLGGTKGKWRYYAYYNSRHGDGWRDNSSFVYHSYYGNVQYQFSDKGSLSLQFSRMDYREQIAGGLTDNQFAENSRSSTRTRNFFSPVINIPALIFNYKFNDQTKMQVSMHYLTGERNSVQYLNPPNVEDTINTTIASYNPRQVDRDYYNGFTIEGRLLHNYPTGRFKGTLAAGVRLFDQVSKRRQKGAGTTGNDFNLSLIKPYSIDLRLHSTNYAAFAENLFQVTEKLTVTPGVRFENIKTGMTGVINNATIPVDYASTRNFPLFGTGVEYAVTKSSRFYGNISQAYRPFLYANVTPADRIDIIDPELKDSKGYDIDLGYRGSAGSILKFDVNGYYLFYGKGSGN